MNELTIEEVFTVVTGAITVSGFFLMIVSNLIKRIAPPQSMLTLEEQQMLTAVLNLSHENAAWHKLSDENGVPLAYTPRNLIVTQERIARQLDKVSAVLDAILVKHDTIHENFRDLHSKANKLIVKAGA